VARRLSTVAGFYRFAVIDGLVEHSPAEFVRRPKIDTDSTTLGLDRMKLARSLRKVPRAAGSTTRSPACSDCWAYGSQRRAGSTSRTSPSSEAIARSPCWARDPSWPSSPCHLEWPERSTWRRVTGCHDHSSWPSPGCDSTATPPPGSCAAWPRKRGSPRQSFRTPCATHSSSPHSTPVYRTDRRPPLRPQNHHPL
jgi:hypothetical protein